MEGFVTANTTSPNVSLLTTTGTDYLDYSTLQQAGFHDNATLLNVSNSSSPGEKGPDWHFYKNAQMVTGLVCYPILCLIGIIGNVIILIVLSRKSMHTSTNVYLSALAVSDIIKLINDSLYFLVILLLKTEPIAGNRAFGYLYPYAHFVFNMSVCVSAWLTVSVAVERYVLVCHPARSKSLCTIPRARIISTAVFFVMTLLALPSALRYRTVYKWESKLNRTVLDVELTELWEAKAFVDAYTWVQNLLRSIVPLFVLIFVNVFIINALRKTRANKKMAQRNRITVMLIIVIIFFLFCIIPDAVMSAFFGFGYVEADDFLIKGVREITDMLLAVNAAMNIVVYIIFNSVFRQHFCAVFCKCCIERFLKDGLKHDDPQYRRLSEQTHHSNGVNNKKGTPKTCQVESSNNTTQTSV